MHGQVMRLSVARPNDALSSGMEDNLKWKVANGEKETLFLLTSRRTEEIRTEWRTEWRSEEPL